MTHLWATLLLVLIPSTADAPPATDVVTPLDYFDSGRRKVEDYLGARDALRETADAAMRRCARVEVRYEHDANTYSSALGSGVLLGDGRHLLTAGHVVKGLDEGEIRVTFALGKVLSATVVDRRFEAFGEDWAILELDGSMLLPDVLDTAQPNAGELALVLGYPSHIGVDAEGDVVFGEATMRALEPLVTLGTVRGVEPLTLDPHVGAVPTEGISGGPVFDGRGRLLGIMVSVQRDAGSRSSYHYRVVPVSDIDRIAEWMASPGASMARR